MIINWLANSSRTRLTGRVALAIGGALLVSGSLFAQRNSIPRELLPPELLMQPSLTVEERDTIQRALEDLKSSNPELRAGAAMLLGKYHANEAKEAVVAAIDDPSPRVRRAVLVTVAEWRHGLSVDAVEPVLRHIADPDVEVRRAVSAVIPQMMSIWRTARMVRPNFARQKLSPEVQKALLDAYLDEDAVVRRNVLLSHHNLGLPMDPDIFITLLSDSDPKVRLEAIPLAINYGQPVDWAAPAKAIIEGDDNVAKVRLTAELGRRGSEEGLELLRMLSANPDPEIAAEARLALLRWVGEPHQLDWLIKALAADQLTQDQGQRLIQILGGYRELAVPLAPALTQLRSSVLRQEAVRMFIAHDLALEYPELPEKFLTDSNPDIRSMAVNYYFSTPDLMTEDRELSLLDNPYPDVRVALVQVAMRKPRTEAGDLLFDLMLDESVDVRISALEAFSGLRLPGWADIVENSLADPDFAMQRTAVVILLRERQFPRREEILREYIEDNPKSPLVPRIRTEISEGQLIEIDMNL